MANPTNPAVHGTSSRLASLDALRGFDLFWICGADAFGHAFLKAANGPVSHTIADQLEHVAWQGFRFYDLIFPLFVFISGISIVLSRGAKPEAGDRSHAFLGIAKRAALPWDCILSAEVFGAYKPDPRTYGGVARVFGVPPEQVMLVAAHHDDLEGARACGLQTAYIERSLEFGAGQVKDVRPRALKGMHARDLLDLAQQLGR
jgi:hypothetical protein